MSLSALLNDPEALEKDLQESASSKEDFEGKMAGLAYGDGLMTAIIVGPEAVPQTEWLPLLLSSADAALDGEDARLLTSMVLAQYGAIIKSLRSRSKPYEPLFWKDGEGRLIRATGLRDFLMACAYAKSLGRSCGKTEHKRSSLCSPFFFKTEGSTLSCWRTAWIRRNFSRMRWVVCLIGFKHSTLFGKSARPVTGARTERLAATIPASAAPAKNTRSAA